MHRIPWLTGYRVRTRRNGLRETLMAQTWPIPQGIRRALHALDSMTQSDSRLDRLADQRIGENGRPAKWIFETVDTMSALPQPGRFLIRCQPSLLPNVDHALERAVMSG